MPKTAVLKRVKIYSPSGKWLGEVVQWESGKWEWLTDLDSAVHIPDKEN